ncbi:phosphatidylinositol-specific phospholipase C/glycerophosphodiester phosphodiesterase family protein [Jeotgalibacillus marinus]|uniref:Phosphatidylinositol-specific phospholipase C/glycerophosphodiester phosphodiesterase family protein n=1 Tax=Jeotgalibacillus marinus TaxID=86667 RepID=A0ABV3Q193_9BACL
MNFIAHRINTIEELKNIPLNYGVEIDLRDLGERLILQHDPFKDGEDFEEYLKHYHHGTMIVNIKSERIEHKVLELLKLYNITDYFFLDSSFPMIHLLSKNGKPNIALRFSEFEGLETILAMEGKVKWVWIDCFTKLPITKENCTTLKNAGFKLCLVSPELQGRPEDIMPYKQYINEKDIMLDAICTKSININAWRS